MGYLVDRVFGVNLGLLLPRRIFPRCRFPTVGSGQKTGLESTFGEKDSRGPPPWDQCLGGVSFEMFAFTAGLIPTAT